MLLLRKTVGTRTAMNQCVVMLSSVNRRCWCLKRETLNLEASAKHQVLRCNTVSRIQVIFRERHRPFRTASMLASQRATLDHVMGSSVGSQRFRFVCLKGHPHTSLTRGDTKYNRSDVCRGWLFQDAKLRALPPDCTRIEDFPPPSTPECPCTNQNSTDCFFQLSKTAQKNRCTNLPHAHKFYRFCFNL